MHEADDVVIRALVDRQPRVRHAGRRSARPRRPWCPPPGTRPRCAAAAPRGSAACPRRRPRRRCAARPRSASACAATRSRSSCSVIASRPCRGSPPSSLTTTLTETDSSQTTGRARRGDHVERRRREQRDPHGALQRQALRRQLAEHQGEEGDARRSRWRTRAAPPAPWLTPQPTSQLRSSSSSVSAPKAPADQRGEGDADLHRRQEPVGVGRRAAPPSPRACPLGQRPHLALAQRDQGHLGGGEEPADGHDDKDDDNVQDDLHVAIADFPSWC